jgi:hypothetical protein
MVETIRYNNNRISVEHAYDRSDEGRADARQPALNNASALPVVDGIRTNWVAETYRTSRWRPSPQSAIPSESLTTRHANYG